MNNNNNNNSNNDNNHNNDDNNNGSNGHNNDDNNNGSNGNNDNNNNNNNNSSNNIKNRNNKQKRQQQRQQQQQRSQKYTITRGRSALHLSSMARENMMIIHESRSRGVIILTSAAAQHPRPAGRHPTGGGRSRRSARPPKVPYALYWEAGKTAPRAAACGSPVGCDKVVTSWAQTAARALLHRWASHSLYNPLTMASGFVVR